jgi:hypothetical protein
LEFLANKNWEGSADVRSDPEIVAAAVAADGCLLRFATRSLRSNPALVARAVAQNDEARKYIWKAQ